MQSAARARGLPKARRGQGWASGEALTLTQEEFPAEQGRLGKKGRPPPPQARQPGGQVGVCGRAGLRPGAEGHRMPTGSSAVGRPPLSTCPGSAPAQGIMSQLA